MEELIRGLFQLGANPNPFCQHFLWDETGVPGENPRLSAEHFHISGALGWGITMRTFSLRIEHATLEVKGERSDHCATEVVTIGKYLTGPLEKTDFYATHHANFTCARSC